MFAMDVIWAGLGDYVLFDATIVRYLMIFARTIFAKANGYGAGFQPQGPDDSG
jgi:hypothetical protein